MGLGAKQKPCVLRVTDTEILLAKESESTQYSFIFHEFIGDQIMESSSEKMGNSLGVHR